MAEDVIELLKYVGWTAKRDLHVVAISLGGMIAQGMSCLIPSLQTHELNPYVCRACCSHTGADKIPPAMCHKRRYAFILVANSWSASGKNTYVCQREGLY